MEPSMSKAKALQQTLGAASERMVASLAALVRASRPAQTKHLSINWQRSLPTCGGTSGPGSR